MGAVVAGDPRRIHQAQVRLVDERGGLNGGSGRRLRAQAGMGQAVQFAVDERDEAGERFLVASLPGDE